MSSPAPPTTIGIAFPLLPNGSLAGERGLLSFAPQKVVERNHIGLKIDSVEQANASPRFRKNIFYMRQVISIGGVQ